MKFSLTIFALLFSLSLFAQLPPELGIGFQGYARKADGSAISNEAVRVKFSIYDKGAQQTVADAPFTEEHNLNTDAYGVFTAEVGSINTATFNALQFDWRNYFLNVQVAVAGGNFVTISDKAFNVVPYAKAAGNGVPAGTIISFAGNSDKIPSGWVQCNGVTYDQNEPQYQRLFQAIGFNWGSENGNFRVPQLTGAFLRGWSGNSGIDPNADQRYSNLGGASGNNVGSFQQSSNKNHNHGLNDPGHIHSQTEGTAVFNRILTANGGGTNIASDNTNDSNEPNVTVSRPMPNAATGITLNASGDAAEARPYNAAVLYIIKL